MHAKQMGGQSVYLGHLYILGNLSPILLFHSWSFVPFFVLTVLWILAEKWRTEAVLVGDDFMVWV